VDLTKLPPAIAQIYQNKTMHDLEFFAMTGCLDWTKQGDDELVLEPLIQYLAKWPDEILYVFEDKMAELLFKLDTPEVARRAYRTDRNFSGDDFLYVRCVALVNGRAYYNKILEGTKKLDSGMEFEAILSAPAMAWARKHHADPAEYPHLESPCYETGSNEEAWRQENVWTECAMPLGWRMEIPQNWRWEESDGCEQVFYPPDSSLTVRITPFHAEKAGKPAPAKGMEQAFLQTVSPDAAAFKAQGYEVPGFRVKFFEATERTGGSEIFRIYAGYFAKGELLVVNFFGETRKECEEAMKILHTLQKL